MRHDTAFLLIALLLLTVPAMAQQVPEGPPPRSFERIERLRKVRLIEMLEMGEDQSVRFFARMNEHEKNKRDLHQERMAVLDRLERLVRNPSEEGEYDQLFAQIEDIDARIAAERKRFFEGLRDLLSNEQRAKLLLFDRRFDIELREAMREVQRRRHENMERQEQAP